MGGFGVLRGANKTAKADVINCGFSNKVINQAFKSFYNNAKYRVLERRKCFNLYFIANFLND